MSIWCHIMSYQWMRNPGTPKSVKYWSCALGKSMYLKRSYRFLSSQPSFPEHVLALETLQGEARTFSEPFSEPIGHDRTYPSCFLMGLDFIAKDLKKPKQSQIVHPRLALSMCSSPPQPSCKHAGSTAKGQRCVAVHPWPSVDLISAWYATFSQACHSNWL